MLTKDPNDTNDLTVDPVKQAQQGRMAVANKARQEHVELRMRKAQAIIDDALAKDDVHNRMWTYNVRTRIMRALGVGEKQVTWLVRRKLKMPGGLEGARRTAAGLPNVNDPKQHADATEANTETTDTKLWKWNVLDLFDRLVRVFDVVEADDEDEDDEESMDQPEPMATWLAWRVFLASAFGLALEEVDRDHDPSADPGRVLPSYPGVDARDCPRGAAQVHMGATTFEIFSKCTGRSVWPWVQAKTVSLIVGRRGGKSYITAVIGIYLACCRKYRLKLGTKGMVMILARDRKQAGTIRNYILAFLKALPELREMFADDPTKELIELRNGITIEVRAAGPEGTRGYTVVGILADEIAFWPTNEESANQDKKVMQALRPSTAGVRGVGSEGKFKGPITVLLSSPYAKRGVLYDNFRKWFGLDVVTLDTGEESPNRHLVWNADSLSMRPSEEILDEVRDEYEDDPENAKAEYGALFRSDLESIYSRSAVEAVCVPGRYEEGYTQSRVYRAFVDPSGGSADSYVVAIGYTDKRVVAGEMVDVSVLVKVVEWTPKFDPEDVSKQVAQLLKQFKISSVTGDAYGGEWPRDPLRKAGIDYVLCEKTRSELYLDFLPVVNSGRCELLDANHHRKAVNQFSNLERRVGRTGRDSVDHPRGGHDDVANAIAGVMVGCTGATGYDECTW